MYAYHLPAASLSNLVDIFISLSTLDDSLYALCHLDDFKFLADMIEHIRLPLKVYIYRVDQKSWRIEFWLLFYSKLSLANKNVSKHVF